MESGFSALRNITRHGPFAPSNSTRVGIRPTTRANSGAISRNASTPLSATPYVGAIHP